MKKVLSFLLICVLIISVAACGGNGYGNSEKTSDTNTESEKNVASNDSHVYPEFTDNACNEINRLFGLSIPRPKEGFGLREGTTAMSEVGRDRAGEASHDTASITKYVYIETEPYTEYYDDLLNYLKSEYPLYKEIQVGEESNPYNTQFWNDKQKSMVQFIKDDTGFSLNQFMGEELDLEGVIGISDGVLSITLSDGQIIALRKIDDGAYSPSFFPDYVFKDATKVKMKLFYHYDDRSNLCSDGDFSNKYGPDDTDRVFLMEHMIRLCDYWKLGYMQDNTIDLIGIEEE